MNEQVAGDANKLIEDSLKQLEEHKEWLRVEIGKLPASVQGEGPRAVILALVDKLKVRVVKAHNQRASIVYDYPDELFAFLRSPLASPELQKSLEGGFLLANSDQPSFTFERGPKDQ